MSHNTLSGLRNLFIIMLVVFPPLFSAFYAFLHKLRILNFNYSLYAYLIIGFTVSLLF